MSSLDSLDDPRLLAGVAEVARRHRVAGPHGRFADGSLPVYALGSSRVVKLYPPCYVREMPVEASALRAVDGRLGIPTPRVEATGEIDAWAYLLMSRLEGDPVAVAWPDVPGRERERLTETLGVALSRLHAIDVAGIRVPRPDWAAFVREQSATATARQRARGLSERWLEQIPEFLAGVPLPDPRPALLHTEVMREHLLVRQTDRGWTLSGLFDFEPAMVGASDYEFASVGVFVTCGEPSLLRRLLLAYGTPERSIDDALSRRFLAYALLHRYANLPWYLRRLPPPEGVSTLSDLALRWWPVR